ncbi:MAG TPA: hypothetical protein K8W13_09370 [Enterococcus columbae]|nr:hypothetical protein [Enterococcus columbae]
MEENILFNLGNRLADSKDEKELIRMAQYDAGNKPNDFTQTQLPDNYLIVKFPESDHFTLFKLND